MNKRYSFRFCLTLMLASLVFLSGCGGGGGGPTYGDPVIWNFLVYMDGDNDLDLYTVADLNEMEQVGSNADINVLVLMDRFGDTGTWLYYVNT